MAGKVKPIVTEPLEWIDVSDELPDAGTTVLVCYERNDSYDRDVTIASYDDSEDSESDGPWQVDGGLSSFGIVLYWAHIPLGPSR